VIYPDSQRVKLLYNVPRVSTLRPDWNAEKVQIIELRDAAAMLEQADRNLLEQEIKIRDIQDRLNRLRREDGTLRFTIACLIAFSLFQAGLLIWIATRCSLLYGIATAALDALTVARQLLTARDGRQR